jgi:hypothetical protein
MTSVFPVACVQTSSEVHPFSYPILIRCTFPRDNARSGHDADHLLHLVPRLRMSEAKLSPLVSTWGSRTALLLLIIRGAENAVPVHVQSLCTFFNKVGIYLKKFLLRNLYSFSFMHFPVIL